ncbi:hypothetical protein LG047_07170 [Methylocystis sp. WRRC1]|uniref:hypothetical protein n=1 Tax=Methylocystis sp. WRRC1 TaxID=1732014 RepID=UPI001D1444FD|nr:hypothetical protein [Methylocystis sp. WRRC1]MCC3245098.1 hypothetical protein [Methylocystis sp. WRRC1]
MNAPFRHDSPELVSRDADWIRRDALCEYASVLESLAVSLGEAAYRGADTLAEMHLRQIIATTRTATATFREIGKSGDAA